MHSKQPSCCFAPCNKAHPTNPPQGSLYQLSQALARGEPIKGSASLPVMPSWLGRRGSLVGSLAGSGGSEELASAVRLSLDSARARMQRIPQPGTTGVKERGIAER